MPVSVQLPGYNKASPLTNLLSAVSEGANAYRGFQQGNLASTENQAAAAKLPLEQQQAQAQAQYTKDLSDPTTPASQEAVSKLGADLAFHRAAAAKLGLPQEATAPLDQLLDVVQNGRPTGLSQVAPGQSGPPQETRQPLSGLEAQRLADSPLLKSIDSLYGEHERTQQMVSTANLRWGNGGNSLPVDASGGGASSLPAPTQRQTQNWGRVQTLLESARGNPAAMQAERDIYATQKINEMFKQYPDLNKMPSNMVDLVVSEAAKVAQGGAPDQAMMGALTPGALQGSLSGVYGKLVNNPTPANAAAFLKQYGDYAQEVSAQGQKLIADKYGRIINTNRASIGPYYSKMAQDNYINRFSSPDQSGGKVAPHGQSIQQNGHTYNWNAQTGQYE